MTLTNAGVKRSAIDIESGGTLNLWVAEDATVTVNSGLGEDGQGLVPGKGGYAGIHVPENATLNLRGHGIIKAIGGKAGDGSYVHQSPIGGAGGGGAGAGIGGNGGNGGAGKQGASESGKQGENCGNVNVYNDMIVYAYGGGGGSGAAGTLSGSWGDGASGAGGGYPAAGIGGGGAGGAGGSCCSGGGGYSGGNEEFKIDNKGINGLSGSCSTINSGSYDGITAGSGYFLGADGSDINGVDKKIAGLGGLAGCGNSLSHLAGSGGTAGKGGTIKVSNNSKIYAFNGNRFTDETSYENGKNQCPIYAQNGIKLAKYNHTQSNSWSYSKLTEEYGQMVISKLDYCNELIGESDKLLTINNSIDILKNIDMSKQGIGSGAGYIEISNGSYTIDSSLN